ncbi:inositol 2-dehydrogenase-like [Zophobas morio]|uniref:inositol 2-dehydrogenase-like n=1 Tax=Zophobas morio TaxID=2755281 RepID=UPI00308295FC
MATLKYKKPSPYVVPAAGCPPEDTKYQEYEKNLELSTVGKHQKFGFALFGVGRAGTIHLSFLIKEPKTDLLYVIDDDKTKLEKLKKYWNLESVKFLTNAESDVAFKDPRVRAVVISSPTHTHEDIVTKALSHNKGVFCEKPVAENLAQTKLLYDKAKQVKQPLFSAFNRRFDPSFASIRNRVRAGDVGRVLTVKVCSRDSPLPTIQYLSTSGGIFHDCAVHDIDMTLYILGEYPTKVTVAANANIPEIAEINDYDTVGIMLSFASGAIGIIDLSRHSTYGYDQRVEVFGQKGMIKAENRQPIYNVETYTERDVVRAPIHYSFPSRYQEGYENEMRHFLEVLEGKTSLSIDTKDVLAVSKIATACEESVRTGNSVEIKWSKDELPHPQ